MLKGGVGDEAVGGDKMSGDAEVAEGGGGEFGHGVWSCW